MPFHPRRGSRLVLHLTGMLLALAVIVVLGSLEGRPVAARSQWLTPYPTPRNDPMNLVRYPGIYAVDFWWGLDPQRYHLTGALYNALNWSAVETSPGRYDWSVVDSWLDFQVQRGKVGGIPISTFNGRCCGGINALPDYLKRPDTLVRTAPDWSVPKYWHPDYLDAYRKFIYAFGARYRNDPRLGHWHRHLRRDSRRGLPGHPGHGQRGAHQPDVGGPRQPGR